MVLSWRGPDLALWEPPNSQGLKAWQDLAFSLEDSFGVGGDRFLKSASSYSLLKSKQEIATTLVSV